MKILRICWEWPPPWSGLAPGPFEITAAQVARGHAVTYVCGGSPSDDTHKCSGVNVKRAGEYKRLTGAVFSACVGAAKEYIATRKNVDVVHGHGILTLWINVLRMYGLRGVPYVYHFHSCAQGADEKNRRLGVNTEDSPGRWIYRRALRACEKTAAKTADRIIAVSESVKNEVVSCYGVSPDRVDVVDNGVNCETFSPEGPDLRSEYGLAEEDTVLLFVGIIRPLKNIDLVLEAMSRLPENVKLLAVGPWDESYKRRLDEIIDKEGLQGRVLFPGPMNYDELPRVYRTGDIFLLPSSTEGFPKVVLEAAATGLPVIASGFRTGGILGDAINFLDEARLSPELISENVEKVIKGAGNRPADVSAFREVYDWKVKVDAIEKIYKEILTESL